MREKVKINGAEKEKGFVLVMALCFLVIMSLLGIFATQISNIELQTSTNNEKFQTSFTLGEAVTVESVAILRQEPINNLKIHTPDLTGLPYQNWLSQHQYFEGNFDNTKPDFILGDWTTGVEAGASTPTAMNDPLDQGGIQPPGFTVGTDLLHFAVQDTGRSSVSDISEGSLEIRNYYLYGNYNVGRNAAYPGSMLLEMGYRYPLVEDESGQM